jgi:hypothetical protein
MGEFPSDDPRTPTYGRRTRGAVAGMARKHCEGCGLTIPNRARSPYCGNCYEARATERALARKRALREARHKEQVIAILTNLGR